MTEPPARKRLSTRQRRAMILAAAIAQARGIGGLKSITFESVAERCPIRTSAHTVRRYFVTEPGVMLAVVWATSDEGLKRQAIALGLDVVTQP